MAARLSLVLLIVLQALSVLCRTTPAVEAPEEDGLSKTVNVMYKVYEKCETSDDVFSCMKVRALRFADRALKVNTIPVFGGIEIVKNEETETSRALNVPDFNENELPKDPAEKQQALDDMLYDRFAKFLKTHTIQFSIPKILEVEESGDSKAEGRGKLKKLMGPFMFGAMLKGGLMAYALKAVGLLAAKALLVSKIALVLASIIALKKLFSHGGHGESKTIEIVQKPQISHAHTYSSGHDFGGSFGGGGGGGQEWQSSGHGGGHSGGGSSGGYGRSMDGSVPTTVRRSGNYEVPVGNGVDSFARRSYQDANSMAYRGQMQ